MVTHKYILASASPRRRELLDGLGLPYEVRLLPGIDETYSPTLTGEEIPIAISQKKAEAYLGTLQANEVLIAADTIVLCEDQVLGKPADEAEAVGMLRLLRDKTHEVITGVTLLTPTRRHSFASTSRVTFSALTDEEITHYVTRYRPLDKAGAYGIQEWIGYIGVSRIEGSYFNVMGLPVQRLYEELKAFIRCG